MQWVDLTFPSVAENLAFEDLLLSEHDRETSGATAPQELLRFWDARSTFVVLGRGSRFATEINQTAVEGDGVPVYRRVTGGTSIVAAEGCLFYALLLSMQKRPYLRHIDAAHDFVGAILVDALGSIGADVQWLGTCDLVVDDRKVSGNSLRLSREWVLYHGTLLLDMNLDLIARYLNHPPREPDYRRQRNHQQFLSNLHLGRDDVIAAMVRRCQATASDGRPIVATDKVQELARTRYLTAEWTHSR